jgi:hypothetical protein
MPKNEELATIDSTDLLAVNGGVEVEGSGTVTLPGGSGTGTVKVRRSNYESCLANNRRQAAEAFPDNRWFWQRWMGQPDPNAQNRANYERQGAGQCGQPPA